MPKFAVYTDPKKSEPVVRLALSDEDGDGEVRVIAVDEHGVRVLQGYLLRFTSRGTIYLESAVSRELGFQLNPKRNTIVTENS